MRKFLAAMAAAMMIAGPAAAAGQGNGSPLEEGNLAGHPAAYGLCRAYFSGQGGENGNKNSAPPFVALAEAADDGDPSTTNDIEEFCSGIRPSNGQGKGKQDDSNAPAPGPRG